MFKLRSGGPAPATPPQTGSGEGAAPVHVAIIMDGNGRWAKARGLPRLAGHRQGVDALRGAVRAAAELGVQWLTLYAFSTENWRRPPDEVVGLMDLLRFYLKREARALERENTRMRFIGDRTALAADLQAIMSEGEAITAHCTGMTLQIALNYGGRAEILAAARTLAARAAKGEIRPEEIDEAMFSAALSAPEAPDPDLVIRTSGEQRISNFLLWQSAYAEYVFLPTLWPDFDKAAMEAAFAEYGARKRRYGGV